MNTRWAITILCNTFLFATLLSLRPRNMRWLWISQSFVMLCTIWNVLAWYLINDNLYNIIWRRLDFTQALIETIVFVGLIKRSIRYMRLVDALATFTIFVHLRFWLAEKLPLKIISIETVVEDLVIRKWVNILAIVMLAASVYYDSRRNMRHGDIHVRRAETTT